jgi:hypothetical protein
VGIDGWRLASRAIIEKLSYFWHFQIPVDSFQETFPGEFCEVLHCFVRTWLARLARNATLSSLDPTQEAVRQTHD